MVKIRNYQHTDRYQFEKMILANYQEKKGKPPETQKIIDTIGFFTSFPQCGNIYLIFYDKTPIGYCIVLNQWKLQYGKIAFKIDELYINKNYKKYKPEIKLIENLIKHENVHSIEVKLDKYNSRRIFKFFDFEREFGPFFIKNLNENEE